MNKNILYKLKKNLRLVTEYPLVEIQDRILAPSNLTKIPNNVYQTWENRFLGKTHARSLNDFRNNNPTLSFYLYEKEKRDKYIQTNWGDHQISRIYFKSLFGPLRADIFRYCILYDLGGYYFDIAKACKTPLNELHGKNHEGIITFEDNECFYPPIDKEIFNLKRPFNYFLQWGLAFSPRHSFLYQLINEISKNYTFYKNKVFHNPKLAILNFTGPGMYTKVMRDYISNNQDHRFNELDIKFNNNGIFKLPGSSVRHYMVPSYTYETNSIICT